MLLAPVQHKLGPRWWLCQRHQRTILLPSAEGYKGCSEAAKLYSPPRWHEVGRKAQVPATQPDVQVQTRPLCWAVSLAVRPGRAHAAGARIVLLSACMLWDVVAAA